MKKILTFLLSVLALCVIGVGGYCWVKVSEADAKTQEEQIYDNPSDVVPSEPKSDPVALNGIWYSYRGCEDRFGNLIVSNYIYIFDGETMTLTLGSASGTYDGISGIEVFNQSSDCPVEFLPFNLVSQDGSQFVFSGIDFDGNDATFEFNYVDDTLTSPTIGCFNKVENLIYVDYEPVEFLYDNIVSVYVGGSVSPEVVGSLTLSTEVWFMDSYCNWIKTLGAYDGLNLTCFDLRSEFYSKFYLTREIDGSSQLTTYYCNAVDEHFHFEFNETTDGVLIYKENGIELLRYSKVDTFSFVDYSGGQPSEETTEW